MSFEQQVRGPLANVPLEVDGDSWDVGFSASLLWEPLQTTRLGLRYRSQVSHELSGDLTLLENTAPVSTSFTLPMSLTFSVYHDFTERFALMADIGWTNWSAFERNVITFSDSGIAIEAPRNFRDVWTMALGAHIRPADRWLLMFGGGYTSSAVDDVDRTPDLPVDQQIRISAGFEYGISERFSMGASYSFLDLGTNEIDQTQGLNRRVVGDYEAYSHLIAIYGSLTF